MQKANRQPNACPFLFPTRTFAELAGAESIFSENLLEAILGLFFLQNYKKVLVFNFFCNFYNFPTELKKIKIEIIKVCFE